MLKKKKILIESIPAILWGDSSEKVYLSVHGKMGCKEDAENFAQIANKKGYQTLSFDLAEHGERKNQKDYPNNIWNGMHDLNLIADYAQKNWQELNICAVSLGAFYSLMTYQSLPIRKCLFISPIVDMEKLITTIMSWAHITGKQLQQAGKITTDFGETLDWSYYQFVKEHPVLKWTPETFIFYGMKDNLTDFETIMNFTKQFNCKLSTWMNLEHFIQKEADLKILENWLTENC